MALAEIPASYSNSLLAIETMSFIYNLPAPVVTAASVAGPIALRSP